MFPKNLTWKDAEDYLGSGKDVILIPIGSIEGHGYHLPLNTDVIIAEEIASRVACKRGYLSLLAITYTITPSVRFGNVELSNQTFESLVEDILESFVKFGVKRFIMVLGHGGLDMKMSLIKVASSLFTMRPEVHTSLLHISKIISKVSSIDTRKDRHAGEWETSFLLYFKPEVVGEKRVKDFTFPSKHAIIGDPTIATKEKGEELTLKTVNWINDWIKERLEKPGVYYNW
uniref:Creatininase n=1 Tax=uncultured marine crenarchaeote E37-7F TaxID=907717 RepID=G9BAQ9_9ARCH|nr:creatininase [uncultured marine crenarchaeote E37-7F]